MSFKFNTFDDIDSLPDQIRLYLPRYIDNRITEFKELQANHSDFTLIRDFCHKVIGSARSYNLHQLEQLTQSLQTYARQEDIEKIELLLSEFESYLLSLKSLSN